MQRHDHGDQTSTGVPAAEYLMAFEIKLLKA
jgi:hypothetical protein